MSPIASEESTALTAVLYNNFTNYTQHYPKVLAYEELTEKAKAVHLFKKIDTAKVAGQERAALKYSPPEGYSVTFLQQELGLLKTHLGVRLRTLGEEMHVESSIHHAAICMMSQRTLDVLFDSFVVFVGASLLVPVIPWSELHTETTECLLGRGSFGAVFRVLWRPNQPSPLAAKRLL